MRSRALAMVVVAALGLILVFLLRGGELDSGAASGQAVSGVDPAVAADAAPEPAPASLEAGLARSDVELAESPPPAGAASSPLDPAASVIFRGRCVASIGGAPLAGVTVKFMGREHRDTRGLTEEKVPWADPVPIATGDDGRFEIRVPEAPEREFYLTLLRADRGMRAAYWEAGLRAGTVKDLGDVVMQGGQRIAGFLLDQDGKPAAGVMLNVDDLETAIHPAMHAPDSMGVTSGADGSFAFASGLQPGTYKLRIANAGWTIPEPRQLVVAEVQPAETIIRLVRQATAEGLVVDENGQPIAGVQLTPKLQGEGNIWETSSRADGTFKFFQRAEAVQIVALELSGNPIEAQTWNSPVPWGTRGLRIQVKRRPSVQLTVVERESGKPVVDYGIRSSRLPGRELRADLRLSGAHPDGQVEVTGMLNGSNYLLIVPKDPALLPRRDVLVELKDGKSAPVRVELERTGTLRVQVVGRDGKPVPHSDILLLDSRPERDNLWMDPRDGGRTVNLQGESRMPMAYSKTESGADGLATLTAPRGAPELFFQVRGEHLPMDLLVADPFAQPAPILLTVSRGAVIRGRLLHPELASGLFSVILCLPESKENWGEQILASEAGTGNGSFAFTGLIPGDYRLLLVQRIEPPLDQLGFGGRWMEYPDTQVNLLLAEDEEREVNLDASAYGTGTAEVRALLDGKPAVNCQMALMRHEPDHLKRQLFYGGKRCDGGGNSLVQHVAPGSYYGTLLVESAEGKRVELVSTNSIQIAGGQRTAADLQFRWRRVRIQFLAAETGEPLVGWQCNYARSLSRILTADDPGMPDLTDADGVLLLVDAPVGSIKLYCYKDRERRAVEAVELPEALGPDVIVVRAVLLQ